MDYKLFLSLVNDELEYIQPFDFEGEYELMKAAGALVVLKEYIEAKINKSTENEDAVEKKNFTAFFCSRKGDSNVKWRFVYGVSVPCENDG